MWDFTVSYYHCVYIKHVFVKKSVKKRPQSINYLTNMCHIQEFQLILNQSKGHTIQSRNGILSILFVVSNASAQKIHHTWFIMSLQFTHSPASSAKEPLHIPRKASLGCNTAHNITLTAKLSRASQVAILDNEDSNLVTSDTQAGKNFWQQFQ